MFVDASALVAILGGEPEAADFAERLLSAAIRLTSPIAVWETSVALVRKAAPQRVEVQLALADVGAFVAQCRIEVVAISGAEARLALEAHARFGKGRHPARLNMGDCFAYACARSHGVPLLYKGCDFALTDIAAA